MARSDALLRADGSTFSAADAGAVNIEAFEGGRDAAERCTITNDRLVTEIEEL